MAHIVKNNEPPRCQSMGYEFQAIPGCLVNIHIQMAKGDVIEVHTYCRSGKESLNHLREWFGGKQSGHSFEICVGEICRPEGAITVGQIFEPTCFEGIETVEV